MKIKIIKKIESIGYDKVNRKVELIEKDVKDWNVDNVKKVCDFMLSEFGIEKATNVLNEYEESFGLNGLDYLWSLESEDEVYEVLGDYLG